MTATVGTVLVVHDDAAMRAFLTTALEVEGYHVAAVPADDAVPGLARARRPNIILLDLPTRRDDPAEWDANVAAIIWRLRTDPTTARIPLIALSDGSASPASPLPPIQRHLSTPFDLADLYRAVAYWNAPIGRHRAVARGQPAAVPWSMADRLPAPIITPLRWWTREEAGGAAMGDESDEDSSSPIALGPTPDSARHPGGGWGISLWRRLTRIDG